MKFAFIAAEKAHYPVRRVCAVLGVTRAGFYAGWRGRRPRTRAPIGSWPWRWRQSIAPAASATGARASITSCARRGAEWDGTASPG